VQVRRVKLLKNGGNDATNGVLVRIQQDLVVAVRWIVQVKIYLDFLGHNYLIVGLFVEVQLNK
jgi:hypothetical protein